MCLHVQKFISAPAEQNDQPCRLLGNTYFIAPQNVKAKIMTQYSMDGGFSSLQELIPNHAKSTLVVGDMARWKAQGRNLPNLEGLRFIDLSALDQNVLAKQKPDIILSPLISEDFDAVDVAGVLASLNYDGPYRAVTDIIPDPELVRKEVRNYAPHLDFDLVVLPMMAPQH